MRRYQLPPLDLLEAFEAAARHLSFTRAADELSLTQSAISRQIATLEERLNVPLFQRLHRALRLTEAGQQLHVTASAVLQQLHGVTEQLRQAQRQKTVVVTTTPGFAGLWLIPRLATFTATHADVDVRISAGLNLVNLDRDGVDVAIRYGPTATAAPQATRLFGEVMTPVCSPVLRKLAAKPLKRPQDLQHHTLLHTDPHGNASFPDWALWLRAMQIEHIKPAGSLHFSDYDQMMNAAVRGQGVALGRMPLTKGLIKERKLVAPFSHSVASPMGYHLMRSEASARKPEVDDFVAWLLDEAAP
ncbi:MAG: transcriptional regulator GcvA [Cytophagales bacterium]|nr:transcriptional regulator GcvA [Rhizobacter sp.]